MADLLVASLTAFVPLRVRGDSSVLASSPSFAGGPEEGVPTERDLWQGLVQLAVGIATYSAATSKALSHYCSAQPKRCHGDTGPLQLQTSVQRQPSEKAR